MSKDTVVVEYNCVDSLFGCNCMVYNFRDSSRCIVVSVFDRCC